MTGIILVFCLAVVVEALIQYGKTIMDAFKTHEKKTAVTQLTAIAVSVMLCFSANANIFDLLDVSFKWPILGVVITGIFASRGANYVSDLIKKIQSSSQIIALKETVNEFNY